MIIKQGKLLSVVLHINKWKKLFRPLNLASFAVIFLAGCENNIPQETIDKPTTVKEVHSKQVNTAINEDERFFSFDTIVNNKHISVYRDSKILPTLFLIQREGTLFRYVMNSDLEGINVQFEDLNSNNESDVIVQMSDNRSCNFIFLVNGNKITVVDDCENFPQIEAVKLNGRTYYTSFKNLGCAAGYWETKLFTFNNTSVDLSYVVEVDQCHNNKITVTSYPDGTKHIIAKSKIKTYGNDAEFWINLMKELND